MLELLNLDLRLLQFRPGLLIPFPLTPPILHCTFTAFYVLEGPTASLLVADIVLDRYLSVILTVGDACLCYSESLSLSGFSSFGHTASSCLILVVFMTIIHLNPNSELMI